MPSVGIAFDPTSMRYTVPATVSKVTEDLEPQNSSLQTMAALQAAGWTDITVSASEPGTNPGGVHVVIVVGPVCVAVYWNQTPLNEGHGVGMAWLVPASTLLNQ